MTNEDLETLKNLQLPTMSLVEKFCDTPEEVKLFFVEMLSVYEATPTTENAKRIAEEIKSRKSREEKQIWLQQELKKVDAQTKIHATEKYIKQKNAVPMGIPTSGELLSYLDYVPRAVKDELMNAQAAGRILSHLESDNKDLKATVIGKDEQGNPKEAKDFLDKPFATSIQRLEQVADFLSVYKNNQTAIFLNKKHSDMLMAQSGQEFSSLKDVDVMPALAECKLMALQTIKTTAQKISKLYPHSAERLNSLADSYGENLSQNINLNQIAQISVQAANLSAAFYGYEIKAADMLPEKGEQSFSLAEALVMKNLLRKRNQQIQQSYQNFYNKDSKAR